jgi:hypothetical protein
VSRGDRGAAHRRHRVGPALTVAGSKRLTLDRATALGIASPRPQVSAPESSRADELGIRSSSAARIVARVA